jgi:hypothetical protein
MVADRSDGEQRLQRIPALVQALYHDTPSPYISTIKFESGQALASTRER